MSAQIDTSKYSLFVRTHQAMEIRTLVEALKDILIHTNIEVNDQGISIIQMGRERVSLINLHLKSDSFQNFYCERPTVMGLNLINLNSILRSVQSSDILTLFILADNRNQLGILLQDASKNKVTRYMLDLIELDHVRHDIPDLRPDSKLTMLSTDFQQTCRSISTLTDDVAICCAGNQIEFKGKGDFAEQVTQFGETQDGVEFSEKTSPLRPVQGVYSLKKLLQFTKCTNLSSMIKISMINDKPLILEYDITDLGHIKLCLGPKTT